MTAYLVRRCLSSLVVLWLVTVIAFMLVRSLPGDAVVVKLAEAGRIPQEQLDQARAKLGLDKSKLHQYADWMSGLATGNMGKSLIFDGQTVQGRLFKAVPVTLENAILASIVGLAISIPLGVLCAVKQDSWIDNVARVITIGGVAFPTFWVGTVLIVLLSYLFNYFPPAGYAYIWDDPLKNLEQHYLPALILGFALSSTMTRLLRSQVLEVLRQDYVRTAQSKGLGQPAVLSRHVLRNALIPVVTLFGGRFASLLEGSLIMEILFGMPGAGGLTYGAVVTRDYTQVQGNVLFFATLIIMMNLIVDLSYGFLDPRIRYQ
jgi:peptide/nickel transport system permease protein